MQILWGGVNLACPRTSATQSFLSAFIAIIKHCLDYPNSMLDRIYKLSEKRLAVCHWGSRSIKHEFDWLRRIIPNSWGGLQELKKSLGLMELDPTLAHHSSLWGSEYYYSLWKPPIFAFFNIFPNLHSLYDILEPVSPRSSNPINLSSNFLPETLSLSEDFLIKFHAEVKKNMNLSLPFIQGKPEIFVIFHCSPLFFSSHMFSRGPTKDASSQNTIKFPLLTNPGSTRELTAQETQHTSLMHTFSWGEQRLNLLLNHFS